MVCHPAVKYTLMKACVSTTSTYGWNVNGCRFEMHSIVLGDQWIHKDQTSKWWGDICDPHCRSGEVLHGRRSSW